MLCGTFSFSYYGILYISLHQSCSNRNKSKCFTPCSENSLFCVETKVIFKSKTFSTNVLCYLTKDISSVHLVIHNLACLKAVLRRWDEGNAAIPAPDNLVRLPNGSPQIKCTWGFPYIYCRFTNYNFKCNFKHFFSPQSTAVLLAIYSVHFLRFLRMRSASQSTVVFRFALKSQK